MEVRKMWRKTALILSGVLLLSGGLAGCQKGISEESVKIERTAVTILHTSQLGQLEKLVEETYPDIDLQPELTSSITLVGDMERRLRAGHGTDLVVTTQPEKKEAEKFMLDLGTYDFSTKYESAIIGNLSVDGTIYFLPFPGQYYGYIINKTFYDKYHMSYPSSNEELVQSIRLLGEKSVGIGDDGVNFGILAVDNTSFGTFIVGCQVPDFLETPEGKQWISDFKNQKATFQNSWGNALFLLNALLENGLIGMNTFNRQTNAEQIDIKMGNGTLVAAYGNSALLEKSKEQNRKAVEEGIAPEYEYMMLPFFSSTGKNAWVVSSPSTYVGINQTLSDKGSEKRLDACLRIMGLISTPEGQKAIAEDMKTDISYLKDFQMENKNTGLEDYIAQGFVYHVNLPGRIIDYLGKNMMETVAGKISLAQCLKNVDDYYYEGSEEVDYDLSIVGSVLEDFIYQKYNARLEETQLGNLLADSVAELAEEQIAVVNGGAIRASLYKGDVLGEDLKAVSPYDNLLVVLEVSGQTIWDMLENGVSLWTEKEEIPGGRFLQVSGLKYEFDSSKEPGHRLVQVYSEDGTPIELSSYYTIVVNDYMAGSKGYLDGNGDGYTMLNVYSEEDPKMPDVRLVKEIPYTYRDALINYFREHRDTIIKPRLEGRIINLAQKKEE